MMANSTIPAPRRGARTRRLQLAAFWTGNPWLVPFAIAPLLLIHRALSVPQLQAEARVDPKTGLFNARYFASALSEELGDVQGIAYALNNLGTLSIDMEQLEADGTCDALEMTAGSSLMNPMYLFRGGVPRREFAAQMPLPVRMLRCARAISAGSSLLKYTFDAAGSTGSGSCFTTLKCSCARTARMS